MAETERCERCGEKLNRETAIMLEYNGETATYHKSGTVPESESWGGFWFGKACAKAVLNNNGINVKTKKGRGA